MKLFTPENNEPEILINFLRLCLYEDLVDSKEADQMRNYFINFIYSGKPKDEDVKSYGNSLTDDTKKIILKALKETNKREELRALLYDVTIDNNPGINQEVFIKSLKEGWNKNREKSKEYYQQIKELPNFKYIIISEDAPWKKDVAGNYCGAYLLGGESADNTGPYYDSLNSVFPGKEILSIRLLTNKALFIDLLTIPLIISSELRAKWGTDEVFKINGKQLPVIVLELAIEEYQLLKKWEKKTKIALMMPTKTSASIYNYFQNLKSNDEHFFKEPLIATSDWKCIKKDHQKIINTGKSFNYYRSNAISGSNNPDADLLAYALDIKKT